MEREVRTEVPSSSEPRAVVLGLLPVDCSDPQARLPRPRPGHEDLHAEAGGMGRRGGQVGTPRQLGPPRQHRLSPSASGLLPGSGRTGECGSSQHCPLGPETMVLSPWSLTPREP